MPETQTPADAADIFAKALNFRQADDLREQGLFPYFKPLGAQEGNEVVVDGQRMLMACSNDYLGLSQDRRVQAAGIPAPGPPGPEPLRS